MKRLAGFAALAVVFGLSATSIAQSAPPRTEAGNPTRGAEIFKSRCSVCHVVSGVEKATGPSLAGIVGKKVATRSKTYKYSNNLKSAAIVWSPKNLDKWLSNPQKMIPGSRMFVAVQSQKDRADIISYLEKNK